MASRADSSYRASLEIGLIPSQKIRILKSAGEDFEWYPTTPEIMEAMKKDICEYLRLHENDYEANWRGGKPELSLNEENLIIDTFLDIGAGDGRVLDFLEADKKYGIEIAKAQADDLIRRSVFLVGRNYWDVFLIEQKYSLIFSNPPFSAFEKWVNKILVECNFRLLYLVMPVRWKNQKEITRELERYETAVVGEFDFSNADREARGKVNLVRVNAKWIENRKKNCRGQETIEDAFSRWVREYIETYKSNRHWVKSDWRHTACDWKYEELPPRWKLGLDYRIVVNTYWRSHYSLIDDFIIVCKNLGFPVASGYRPDYKLHSTEQKFYTDDGELAFTMRYYTGNKNAHLKINKKLLMKFNIEVAKIRKWITGPEDIEEEFDVPKAEAALP